LINHQTLTQQATTMNIVVFLDSETSAQS